MRLWKAIVAVDLALALGVGAGYLWWGREVGALRQELAGVRAGGGAAAGARAWSAHGIVRLVARDQQVVFLTHEAIPGLMEGMTMAFEAAEPAVLDGLAPGDRVVFTLEQRGGRTVVVRIEKEPRP